MFKRDFELFFFVVNFVLLYLNINKASKVSSLGSKEDIVKTLSLPTEIDHFITMIYFYNVS